MPSYFVIDAYPSVERGDPTKGYIEIEDWDDIAGFDDWRLGWLAKQRPAGPVEIKAVPHDGFVGAPHEFQDTNVPLMSKRLKQVIESAGVNNITFHPITIRNTATGQPYEYFAFNLLGLMSVADAKSVMASDDGDFVGDTRIHELAVDDTKARGMLMFRMKEKFSVILVHRAVKEAIERAGIDTVRFIKPEDFMAL